jgi:hypothetical protein
VVNSNIDGYFRKGKAPLNKKNIRAITKPRKIVVLVFDTVLSFMNNFDYMIFHQWFKQNIVSPNFLGIYKTFE